MLRPWNRVSLIDVLHLRSELSDSLQSAFALRLVFLGSLLIPRKEVIQPHLPIRLPCYDFTPIIGPTFDGYLSFSRQAPVVGRREYLGICLILFS